MIAIGERRAATAATVAAAAGSGRPPITRPRSARSAKCPTPPAWRGGFEKLTTARSTTAKSAKCSTPPAWRGAFNGHKATPAGEVSQVSNTDGLERWCLEKKNKTKLTTARFKATPAARSAK